MVEPKAAGRRNVLILSTLEGPSPELDRFVAKGDNVRVVVPVVRQGIIDWLANDEHAFSQAEIVAPETAAALPAETMSARAGEADVALAIRDALAQFPADEIVVAVRPGTTIWSNRSAPRGRGLQDGRSKGCLFGSSRSTLP